MNQKIIAVAHRGYSSKYPENSETAYKKAIEAKAGFIESDVRLSKDEIPVAIHDPDLLRLTGKDGSIAEMPSYDILSTDRKDGEKILTTEKVLKLALGQIRVLLDIKATDNKIVQKAYNAVVMTGMSGQVYFGLRSLNQIDFMRSISQKEKILAMPHNRLEIEELSRLKINAVRIWEEWFHEMNPSGLPVDIWITAGGPDRNEVGNITESRIQRLVEKEVSAVILNDPSLITGLSA